MADSALLGRLDLGDHLCWMVGDQETREAGTAAYVRAGLDRHQKVLYFGDGPEQMLAGLRACGVDADSAVASGQLQASTAEATYLTSGAFDAQATIEGWRVESARARDQGYRGLRALGDMAWATRPVPGAGDLARYEAQVNRVFADGFAMAVCVYDTRLFDPAALRRVASAHPGGMSAVTAAADVPLLHVTRTGSPPGLRLRGEADLANRRALRTVLEHVSHDTDTAGRALTIDVSELHFADAETARMLIRAAEDTDRMRIVGCTPSLAGLLGFLGAGVTPGLTVEVAA